VVPEGLHQTTRYIPPEITSQLPKTIFTRFRNRVNVTESAIISDFGG
jgi:hypothetical protein